MLAIKISSRNSLKLSSIKPPALGPWDLRVSVAVTCVCGSDLKNIRDPKVMGQIPGHEFSGLVTELSNQSKNLFALGDRVTAFPMMPCHSCVNCKNREFRNCDSKKSLGFDIPGSLAESVVVDSRMVIKIPDSLGLIEAALTEHLACGYRLVEELKNGELQKGSLITIFGDGPIALADLQMLMISGFRNVIVVGKHPHRLDIATRLGAVETFLLDSFLQSEFEGMSNSAAIFAAPFDLRLEQLIENLSPKVLVIEQSRLPLNVVEGLYSRGVSIKPAFAYDILDFTAVFQLITEGKVLISPLVSQFISLKEFCFSFPSVMDKSKLVKLLVVVNKELFDRELTN